MATHGVTVSIAYDSHTGTPMDGGRVLFVHLPRTYGPRALPEACDVHNQIALFGPVESACMVDNKGGFLVRLGGDLGTAMHTAHNAIQALNLKANLFGEPLVHELMPIQEFVAGAVIGQGGCNLRDIKAASGAHVEISPYTGPHVSRQVHISGTAAAVQYARTLVVNSTRIAVPPTNIDNDSVAVSCAQSLWQGSQNPAPVPPMPSSPPPAAVEECPAAAVASTSTALPSKGPVARVLGRVALERQVSERTLVHLGKARWCMLMDRLQAIMDCRRGMEQFEEAVEWKKQEVELREAVEDERKGVQFGRHKTWAHFDYTNQLNWPERFKCFNAPGTPVQTTANSVWNSSCAADAADLPSEHTYATDADLLSMLA